MNHGKINLSHIEPDTVKYLISLLSRLHRIPFTIQTKSNENTNEKVKQATKQFPNDKTITLPVFRCLSIPCPSGDIQNAKPKPNTLKPMHKPNLCYTALCKAQVNTISLQR